MITEIMDRKAKVLTVLKFLIVDDTKAMRDEFAGICRTFLPNARIDEAADAVQAVALINKEMPPYDAVFTDINMPKITGLQLISHLREMQGYQKTPVIVISALSAKADIEKGLQLGAAGYLTRPLQKEDFEIVFMTLLQPLIDKKRGGTHLEADVLVDSLRKMMK